MVAFLSKGFAFKTQIRELLFQIQDKMGCSSLPLIIPCFWRVAKVRELSLLERGGQLHLSPDSRQTLDFFKSREASSLVEDIVIIGFDLL